MTTQPDVLSSPSRNTPGIFLVPESATEIRWLYTLRNLNTPLSSYQFVEARMVVRARPI